MAKYSTTLWENNMDDTYSEEYLSECFSEVTDPAERNRLIDEEREALIDENDFLLDDLRNNLNIELDDSIVLIADLGLWNGRQMGYKTIGNNISQCFYTDCDYARWYVDKLGDLRLDASHHDGTNYVLYREFKPGLSHTQKENFLYKIYTNAVSRQDITRYTNKIGDRVLTSIPEFIKLVEKMD